MEVLAKEKTLKIVKEETVQRDKLIDTNLNHCHWKLYYQKAVVYMFRQEDLIVQKAMQKADREIQRMYNGGQPNIRVKDSDILMAIHGFIGVQQAKEVSRFREPPTGLWRHACKITGQVVIETPTPYNFYGTNTLFSYCPLCSNLKWFRDE